MYYIFIITEQTCSVNKIKEVRNKNMKMNRQKYEIARARACMSFNDVIEAGVQKGTLCRAMNGDDVRPETIGKIAKALKCDVTEIIEN